MAVVTRRLKTLGDVPVPSEISKICAQIKKNKGDRTLVFGNEVRQPFRIRTNVFLLDYALLGGIPYNRTTMIHGRKHSGKTSLAKRIAGAAQRCMPDQKVVWMDAEATFDENWARKQGVSTEELIVVSPDTGEDAVDMAVGLIHARETSLVVVDSLAALLPYKEEVGSAEDEAIPGLQAKLITRMMRRATGAMMTERKRDHFVSLLVLNQHRALLSFNPTGHGKTLPGGHALSHFTSVEILMKNKENVNQTTHELTVNEHAFTIEKNKHNAGMRSGEFQMLRADKPEYGLVEGDIDEAATMITFAKKFGWYSGGGRGGFTLEFGDYSEHYANGEEAVIALYNNEELFEALRIQCIVQNALSQKMPQDYIDYLLGS